MHCAGCAATVQRALEETAGVQAAAVSFTDGRARVEGTDLDTDSLVEAIRGKGYDAAPAVASLSAAELRSEIEHRQALNERQWRDRAILINV